METAKECLEFKQDSKRLEAACVEALSDLIEWQPEDVVRQVFTILNTLETIQNAQPSAQKPYIPYQIQQQVHGLASTSRSSQLLRPACFFWLNQLAATINEHDKVWCSTAVGRSTLSDVYDMYVEAEYPNSTSYEAATKQDSAAVNRKRIAWKRKKETGGKILRLTKEFGLGVVFCIPSRLTYSYFERMSIGYLELLMHGLRNGPSASTFRFLCAKMSDRIADFVQSQMSAKEFKENIARDVDLAMSEQRPIADIKNDRECDELIKHTIGKFPDWMGGIIIGSLEYG